MNDSKTKTVDTAKLVGPAIIALRAHMHVLEGNKKTSKKDGQERFRYDIAKDRSEARIYDTTIAPATKAEADKWAMSSDNQVVDGTTRPLTQYAAEGKPLRLAKIGLLDRKLALEEDAKRTNETVQVRFDFNVTTQSAGLTVNGQPLTELSAGTTENPTATIPAPTTIEGWAKIGRKVEHALFESLTAAKEWGSKDGEKDTRARMIARGVIRERREETPKSK